MAQARLTTCYPLLGRMIVAARQAGHLAKEGGDHSTVGWDDSAPTSLADLGIGRDLAAHAVRLAAVPAEPCATEPPEQARLRVGTYPRPPQALRIDPAAPYTPISYSSSGRPLCDPH